jgi:hypothetical protein
MAMPAFAPVLRLPLDAPFPLEFPLPDELPKVPVAEEDFPELVLVPVVLAAVLKLTVPVPAAPA